MSTLSKKLFQINGSFYAMLGEISLKNKVLRPDDAKQFCAVFNPDKFLTSALRIPEKDLKEIFTITFDAVCDKKPKGTQLISRGSFEEVHNGRNALIQIMESKEFKHKVYVSLTFYCVHKSVSNDYSDVNYVLSDEIHINVHKPDEVKYNVKR